MTQSIKITVPASTANLGPGFDVMGIALSLFLTVTATITPTAAASDSASNVPEDQIKITYEGDSASTVPLSPPSANLITKTALRIAASHQKPFPAPGTTIHVHIQNEIPLGRGLGSSGSAVVAGVILANEVCQLGMNTRRILDWCLWIEGHPDNVSASLLGGFIVSFLHSTVPHHPSDAPVLPLPPAPLSTYSKINLNPDLKPVLTIPTFHLLTSSARSVVPKEQPLGTTIFNLQRLGVLLPSLSASEINRETIWEAMQDRVHQPHRAVLVPGLTEILALTPKEVPGLCGVCMSGAGPSVFAWVVGGEAEVESVGKRIQKVFEGKGVQSGWKALQVVDAGTKIERY
ncbi:hypothetical protein HDV05_005082 [Chytridiales sp. JEL 0842]|nr:hypothetical protein HDV05_005082 [Chytridiales sp. JEL 0842]